MKRYHGKYYFFLAVIFLTLCLAGCVKFETGQTEREEKIDKQQQAKTIRGEWAARLQGGSKEHVSQLTVQLIESVTNQYLDFGGRVADQWREANKGRGVEVESSEMITVVDRWTEKEKHILAANEDNIEYAASYLRNEFQLSLDQEIALGNLVKKYYEVFSNVFLPNDKVIDYSQRLDDSRLAVSLTSDEFKRQFGL